MSSGDPVVRDSERKLVRAKAHLEYLDTFASEWVGGDHHRTWIKPDPDDGRFILIMSTADPVPVDPFSIRLGEFLHNLRSSLDLLAYELGASNPKAFTDAVKEFSEFPIFGDMGRKGVLGSGPQMYASARTKKIGAVERSAEALIEGLQPYKWATGYGNDPLWKLHNLDRINKHRLLHTFVSSGNGFAINPINGVLDFHVIGDIVALGSVLLGDKEVAVGRMSVPPPRKDQFQPKAIMEIAFDDTFSDVKGDAVIPTLTDMYNRVAGDVFPALLPHVH